MRPKAVALWLALSTVLVQGAAERRTTSPDGPTLALRQREISVSIPPSSDTSTAAGADTTTSTTSTTTTSTTPTSTSTTTTPTSSSSSSTTTTSSTSTTSSSSINTSPTSEVVVTYISFSTNTFASSSSSTSSMMDSNGGSGGSGVSTGTIIGLSVAAGIGVLGIIGFVVWKMRRRGSDYDDDDDNAIKWPDLDGGNAMVPLPARPTGRAGVETSALDRSEDAFDSRSIADQSTADLVAHNGGGAGYQHSMGPDGRYYDYDDPSGGAYNHAQGGMAPHQEYYDPSFVPVPASMTPMHTGQGGDPYGQTGAADQYGRTTSPGPYAAYDAGQAGGYHPGEVYGNEQYPPAGVRTPSPGPHAAYGGNAAHAPGPDNGYGAYR